MQHAPLASPDGVGFIWVQVSSHCEARPWRICCDGAYTSSVVAGGVGEGCATPCAEIRTADDKDGRVQARRCHGYVSGSDVSVQGQVIGVALLADPYMCKGGLACRNSSKVLTR